MRRKESGDYHNLTGGMMKRARHLFSIEAAMVITP